MRESDCRDNRRYDVRKKILYSWITRLLAVAILLLVVVLIIQIVTIVVLQNKGDLEHSASYSHQQQLINGKFIKVPTSCGFVKGLVEKDGYSFLGIPYAIAPIKNRRFRNSEVQNRLEYCWDGIYSAVEIQKPCWQFYRNGSYDGSENCLHLNVYTPKFNGNSLHPVVLYVGGDTLDGGESLEIQPSSQLASSQNVVFVSVSIRRSALGFFSHKIISGRLNPPSFGNYGLSDILTSLKWVKYNIRNFGGDFNDVTILGHQSGSTLFHALLKNPFYKTDLFHKVWLSGGVIHDPVSLDEASMKNQDLLELLECDSSECIFAQSPEEILEAVPYKWRSFFQELPSFDERESYHQWLVMDGMILKNINDTQNDMILSYESKFNNVAGSQNRDWNIPIVIGAPQQLDASIEMRQSLDWNITSVYQEYLSSTLGVQKAHDAFHQYYHPKLNHWQQFASMISDSRTICPLLRTYFERFSSHRISFYVSTHKIKSQLGYLASANSDIKAIFDLIKDRENKTRKFTENLSSMFYTFVRTGYVKDEEQFNKDGDRKKVGNIFMVDDRITKINKYGNCDFWNL